MLLDVKYAPGIPSPAGAAESCMDSKKIPPLVKAPKRGFMVSYMDESFRTVVVALMQSRVTPAPEAFVSSVRTESRRMDLDFNGSMQIRRRAASAPSTDNPND
ncbi:MULTISPECIES: hypothetical protein [Burkholderia cepacia complex]|uniref:hypothetical protein n=1 Tax=Burkholderia cepacia complex TaxID=87882 RepID=UPI001CF2E3BF|nr:MULTISPECIES: hypothetical protein [Burkholderia cepacia complex]MCA8057378.1 hypothetical protein [Burkholderia cepacia]MDN7535203.1 hypothetical protein [Burkholderia orbicola]